MDVESRRVRGAPDMQRQRQRQRERQRQRQRLGQQLFQKPQLASHPCHYPRSPSTISTVPRIPITVSLSRYKDVNTSRHEPCQPHNALLSRVYSVSYLRLSVASGERRLGPEWPLSFSSTISTLPFAVRPIGGWERGPYKGNRCGGYGAISTYR